MWAGIYTLDLYCDLHNDWHTYGEFPHQYTDEVGSVCRTLARNDGWVISPDGSCICPKCSGKTTGSRKGNHVYQRQT